MKREHYRWHSALLGRDMELLVFGHAGARVIAFPPRCGRFYDYENEGLVGTLGHHIKQGWVQLICVDSIDDEAFYNNWCHPRDRVLRHIQYERYILDEVLPLSRSLNGNPFLTSLGCSFGAYHAMNIALRHPHAFGRVVALSGRYDLTRSCDGFRNLLDAHYDQDVYFNMPNHYMINIGDKGMLDAIRRLDIKMVIGEYDPFFEDNRRLSEILWQKGIWHQFRVWSGRAHSFRRWREMLCWFV